MGYKFNYLEENGMKAKWFFIALFVLGFHWPVNDTLALAQNSTKTLTVLYSNNINGEIEPCPT